MEKKPKKLKLKLRSFDRNRVKYSSFPREYIDGPKPLSVKELQKLEYWGLSPFAFQETTLLIKGCSNVPHQWMTFERWMNLTVLRRTELRSAMVHSKKGELWLEELDQRLWSTPPEALKSYQPDQPSPPTLGYQETSPRIYSSLSANAENTSTLHNKIESSARIAPAPNIFRPTAPDMGKSVPHTPEYEAAMQARLGTQNQNLNWPETPTAAAARYITDRIATPSTIPSPAVPDPVPPPTSVAAPALDAVAVAAPVSAPAPDNDTEFTVKIKKSRKKAPNTELSPLVPNVEIIVRTIPEHHKLPTPDGSQSPDVTAVAVIHIKRDATVKAWVLQNAAGVCERCNSSAPFRGSDGLPYLEVHHVHQLGNSGSDTVSNTVALCPNCHREIHFGEKREEIVRRLYETVSRLIQEK